MKEITRSCGGCNACCKPFAIPEIGKHTATWCTHCVRGVGCSIYETRPPACRLFECAWLKGVGDECDRPDQNGFIMSQAEVEISGRKIEVLQMLEIDRGAFETPRAAQIIEHVARGPYAVVLRRQISDTQFLPEVVSRRGFLSNREKRELMRQL